MGTLGVGLYDDDTAADVRAAYRDLIADGLSGVEATHRVLADDYGFYDLDDPDYDPAPWLALADTQWRLGRLEEGIKQRALIVVERDWDDAERWGDDLQARRRVLLRLREKLLSPPPPERRLRPRYIQQPDFALGDVVSYRLTSDRLVLLKVVEHEDYPNGNVIPRMELLDWIGEDIPSPDVIASLQPVPKYQVSPFGYPYIEISRASKRDFPEDRLQVVVRSAPYSPMPRNAGYSYCYWKELDQHLERNYGLT